MGYIAYLYDADYDPTDASNPRGTYTPYSFVPAGARGPVNMSLARDFGRRESVMSIPGLDGVWDAVGRGAGPTERVDQSFGFRVFTDGDNDRAYDLLAAQVAPGVPQRLVYLTDAGALWYARGANPRIQHALAAANSWGHGGYCDFVVTWRRGVWTPRYSEAADVFHPGTVFAPGSAFGSRGTTTIAAATQAFAVDARGTAGLDLPTLDDTGPTVTISGPAGGDLGMLVENASAPVRDTTGATQATGFIVPFKLPTAADSVTLAFASRTFTHNGAPFRPTRPVDAAGRQYQAGWFRVVAGVLNNGAVVALGAAPLTGGKIHVDWWRRRA